MATLTGAKIADTYEQLIKLDTETLGADASAKWLETGKAENLPISVSTTRVGIGVAAPSELLSLTATAGATIYLQRDEIDAAVGAGETLGEIKFGAKDAGIGAITSAAIICDAQSAHTENNTNKSGRLKFYTQNDADDDNGLASARMVIDEDGLVGIGVADPDTALEVLKTSTQLKLSYDGSNYASFDVASDGLLTITTADDAEADIILSPAGSVGIGTTEPESSVTIQKSTATVWANTETLDEYNLCCRNNTAVNAKAFAGIAFDVSTDPGNTNAIGSAVVAERESGAGASGVQHHCNLSFMTNDNADNGLTRRMTILSDGRVGIGTASPGSKFAITDTGATQALITSTGIINENSARFEVVGTGAAGSAAGAHIGVYYNDAAEVDNACGYIMLDQASTANTHLWFKDSNILMSSHTETHIGTTSGSIVGDQTSDERQKIISSDAFSYGLDDVNKLTPIEYAFKIHPDENRLGFGAQTTKPIIPEAVYDTNECIDGYEWELDDDGEKKKQVPRSDNKDTKLAMQYVQLIPVLVKAIQELSAKVEALENA